MYLELSQLCYLILCSMLLSRILTDKNCAFKFGFKANQGIESLKEIVQQKRIILSIVYLKIITYTLDNIFYIPFGYFCYLVVGDMRRHLSQIWEMITNDLSGIYDTWSKATHGQPSPSVPVRLKGWRIDNNDNDTDWLNVLSYDRRLESIL